MTKNPKRKLLFITLILTLLLLSRAYVALIPNAQAAEMTTQQKGLAILNDVVGLDMAKYATKAREYPQDSYLGVLPQENVRYELYSNESKLKMLYTFTNGKLQMIDVLESEGSPCIIKPVAIVLEMTKGFLSNYQSYSGNSFYGELRSMLDKVDANKDLTTTFGNVKLEVQSSGDYATFRWTYTFNSVEAPSKCVVLGYKNGFLKYFIDNWNLYKIGSTGINLSEKEAIDIALERARTFSWKVGSGNNTFEVKAFNVTQAMVMQRIFSNALYADKARSQDPLTLYPMLHVWVSLDKFYSGNVYGIEVYVWADTKDIGHIQERFSTMDPAVGKNATVNESAVGALNGQASDGELSGQTPVVDEPQSNSIGETKPDSVSIMWLMLPALFAMVIGASPIWRRAKKNSPRLSVFPKLRSFKIGCVLLCLLISFYMLLVPISTVNAAFPTPKGRAVILGSESIGRQGIQWAKTQAEINQQRDTAQVISDFFSNNGYFDSSNGYAASNYQGSGSIKAQILGNISYNEQNYHRVAVVTFDHGVGRTDIPGLPYGEFHYMFEDNVGLTNPVDFDHFVFDMDIYPRTALGKTFFALINTCMSANLTRSGPQGGGLGPDNRPFGMPFAWTHRTVVDYNPWLNTHHFMSSNGYLYPDDVDFCYIGFPWGSAALCQWVQASHPNTRYAWWLEGFFAYAFLYDMSVIQALDHVSYACFQRGFGDTDLCKNFTAVWPGFDPGYNSTMVVYGNGNIHLKQYQFTVVDRDQSDTEIPNRDVYVDGQGPSNIASTSQPIWANSGSHTIWVTDSWETINGQCTGWKYVFQYYSYGGNNYYTNPLPFSISCNTAITAYFSKAYCPADIDGDGYVNENDGNCFMNAYQSERGDYNWDSRCDFNSNGYIDDYDREYLCDYIDIRAIWHLDEGSESTALDSSPQLNHGTIYGAQWTTGNFGSALNFDGQDDYVSVPNSGSLQITDDITVEAWIKPNSGGAEDQRVIVEKTGSYRLLLRHEPYRHLEVWLWLPEDSGGATLMGGSPISYDQWHHVAFTLNKATGVVKTYVDGVEQASATGKTSSIPVNTNDLIIGKGWNEFDGTIDEVRIYNRALSPEEIADHAVAHLTVRAFEDLFQSYIMVPAYIDGQFVGYTGSTFTVLKGIHTIGVEGFIDGGYFYLIFEYFDSGSSGNPTTLTITSDTTVTAYYHTVWL